MASGASTTIAVAAIMNQDQPRQCGVTSDFVDEWIDDREKSELMEVRIGRADLRDAMLTHQHDGMQVVGEVSTKPWVERGELRQHREMSIGRIED